MKRAEAQSRLTLAEIRREGFQALLDRLGPAGAIRFLQQCDTGHGDYTRDRHKWLDAVPDEEIIRSINDRQRHGD